MIWSNAVEKFDLIVLLLDKNSILFDAHGHKLKELIHGYALTHATLVVVFIGEKANRIISGQQVSEIDMLPPFDDSDGRTDVVLAIQSWIYEAHANMYSGSTVKIRTAIFADINDDLIDAHCVKPAKILGNLEEIEYYQAKRNNNTFELMNISKISKLEALARSGDERAMYALGLIYITGEDVDKDEYKAQRLLYKSYLHGNIDAIFALVDMFDEPTEHFRTEAAKHR